MGSPSPDMGAAPQLPPQIISLDQTVGTPLGLRAAIMDAYAKLPNAQRIALPDYGQAILTGAGGGAPMGGASEPGVLLHVPLSAIAGAQ